MNTNQGAISLIELHDARIAAFRLQMGGKADFEIAHLVVFLQVGSEEYDVWSFAARIHLQGVRYFELTGELAKDDRVLDAEFTGNGGNVLAWKQLAAGAPINRIVLDFASGVKLTLACETAQISLGERVKFLERWTGPLITQGS